MSSHPRTTTLTLDILELVFEEVETPNTLLNLACTCSTLNSNITRSPFRFYLMDLRFQRRRKSDPEFSRKHPPTLPGLINAIKHEDLDTFNTILEMYQKELSDTFADWPTDESGKVLSPTPIEAAITARRLDVFQILIRAGSGCELVLGDKLNDVLDRFQKIQFVSPPNHWVQLFFQWGLREGSIVSLSALPIVSVQHGNMGAPDLLYRVLESMVIEGR